MIDEGPATPSASLVVGNKKVDTQNVRVIEMEQGSFSARTTCGATRTPSRTANGAVGYIFADVKPDIRFLEARPLDLVYQIEEGERYRVGKSTSICRDYPHTQITTVLNGCRTSRRHHRFRELRDSCGGFAPASSSRRSAGGSAGDRLSPPTPRRSRRPRPSLPAARRRPGRFAVRTLKALSPSAPPAASGRQRPMVQCELHGPAASANSPSNPAPAAQPAPGPIPSQFSGEPARRRFGPPVGIREPGSESTSPTSHGSWHRHGSPATCCDSSTRPTAAVPAPLPPPGTTPNYRRLGSAGHALRESLRPGAREYRAQRRIRSCPTASAAGSGGRIRRAESVRPGLNFFGDRDPGGFLGTVPDEDPAIFLPLRPEVAETETGRFMFSAGVNSDAGVVGSSWSTSKLRLAALSARLGRFRNGTAFRGRGNDSAWKPCPARKSSATWRPSKNLTCSTRR